MLRVALVAARIAADPRGDAGTTIAPAATTASASRSRSSLALAVVLALVSAQLASAACDPGFYYRPGFCIACPAGSRNIINGGDTANEDPHSCLCDSGYFNAGLSYNYASFVTGSIACGVLTLSSPNWTGNGYGASFYTASVGDTMQL